jgi:LmbE family N-acetylglucosaminyl deacetylase
MSKVLMLASFGLEVVECGGALAAHAEAGDDVHAAVLLSRPASRPQVKEAAAILGVKEVEFLEFSYGEFEVDVTSKEKIVELIRRVKPDIVITQDPVHAQHDLDPDRRIIALLYTEAFALAGRHWHVEACGGHDPHLVGSIYYMTPEEPNCVVEISDYFDRKQEALAALDSQMEFSATFIQRKTEEGTLRSLVQDFDAKVENPVALGLALHTQFDKALALYHGLAGHSGAVLGEAYRREGPFIIDRLLD